MISAPSMLEEMLEAIKRRDEKPKDVPPELPRRPTLKRRLPSSRSLLPKTCKIEGDAAGSPRAKDPDVTEEASPDSRRLDEGVGVEDSLGKLSVAGAQESEYHEEVLVKPVASQFSSAGAGDENPDNNGCNGYAEKASSEDLSELHAARLEDLEKLSAKMKAELEEKEQDNLALSQQVQEYQEKWIKCEENLKNMAEIYQKQIDMLKINIAAVQTSLAANDAVARPKTVESQTPDRTPTRHHTSENGHAKDANDKHNVPYHLTKEFEQKKQAFDEDARVLSKVKPASASQSIKDLRHLKARYTAWQKEYTAYLHDTKVALKKLNKGDGDKPRRWWWPKGCCGIKTSKTILN